MRQHVEDENRPEGLSDLVRAGAWLWACLGPSAAPPPDFEFIRAPATHRFVSRTVQDCNYLQALEGDSTRPCNDPAQC